MTDSSLPLRDTLSVPAPTAGDSLRPASLVNPDPHFVHGPVGVAGRNFASSVIRTVTYMGIAAICYKAGDVAGNMLPGPVGDIADMGLSLVGVVASIAGFFSGIGTVVNLAKLGFAAIEGVGQIGSSQPPLPIQTPKNPPKTVFQRTQNVRPLMPHISRNTKNNTDSTSLAL